MQITRATTVWKNI